MPTRERAARRAYHTARQADAPLAALLDRWYAETLTVVDGQPPAATAEMFRRTAILFEIIADRRGWPRRLR